MMRPVIVALGLALPAGHAVLAQDSAKASPFCFSAKRADRCRSFLVTEVAVLGALASTGNELQQVDDFGNAITFTGGLMFNRSKDRALGVTAQVSTDDPDEIGRSAIELRWRRWKQPGTGAVDFSAGYAEALLYSRTDPGGNDLARGVTAAVTFVPVEWLGVTARAIALRDDEGARRSAIRVGLQFGSAAAPAAALAIVVGFAALFALAGGAGS